MISLFGYAEKWRLLMSFDEEDLERLTSALDGSVAQAIAKYQQGDGSELGEMLDAFFAHLLAKAYVRIGRVAHTDHEGLAQSAVKSFLKRALNGQFPELRHRHELKRLLGTILGRKVCHEFRDRSTQIAGGGTVQNEPANGFEVADAEADPQEEAVCREWLEHMGRKGLRDEAQLILEGYRYFEIAAKLGINESRARRSITMVRKQTEVFFGLNKET
jgi:DNA-directed RNA polymerase specialized sigma24 family protein